MRYHERYEGFFPRITPVVKYLIIVNSCLFLLQLLFRLQWSVLLGLAPALFWQGYVWQPVTYMFLHGGVFHLCFNMLVLWMFGSTLEVTWGPRRFLKFYFICGIGAGLLNAVVTPGSLVPTIGASGAIYGLLLAFGVLFPEQLIYIWGIFPVKAKYFVIGIGVLELLTAMSVTQSRIAHFTHLGGILFGLVYMKWPVWQKAASLWHVEKKRERHLRVVWDRDREKQKLSKEIDALLDKAGRNGIESLSEKEHARFNELSKRLEELESKE
jgi:membrane associated rhomboid family serine protease